MVDILRYLEREREAASEGWGLKVVRAILSNIGDLG
jgi:hypothetical protein